MAVRHLRVTTAFATDVKSALGPVGDRGVAWIVNHPRDWSGVPPVAQLLVETQESLRLTYPRWYARVGATSVPAALAESTLAGISMEMLESMYRSVLARSGPQEVQNLNFLVAALFATGQAKVATNGERVLARVFGVRPWWETTDRGFNMIFQSVAFGLYLADTMARHSRHGARGSAAMSIPVLGSTTMMITDRHLVFPPRTPRDGSPDPVDLTGLSDEFRRSPKGQKATRLLDGTTGLRWPNTWSIERASLAGVTKLARTHMARRVRLEFTDGSRAVFVLSGAGAAQYVGTSLRRPEGV